MATYSLEKRGKVSVKVQTFGNETVDPMTVPGTADTNTDVIVLNPLNPTLNSDQIPRDALISHLSSLGTTRGITTIGLTFPIEMRGFGAGTAPTAGTPVREDPLLRACGLSAAYVTGTATYTPISDNFESCAIYCNLDGILLCLLGCRGVFVDEMVAGQPGKTTFTMQGFFNGLNLSPTATDGIKDTSLTAATLLNFSTKPPACLGVDLDVFGLNSGLTPEKRVIQSVTVNFGDAGDLQRQDDISAANGATSFMIADRTVTGSINPLQVRRGDFDYLQRWYSDTEGNISAQLGSVVGNRIKVTMPKAQFGAITFGTRAGRRTFEIPFSANAVSAAGNDEYTRIYS